MRRTQKPCQRLERLLESLSTHPNKEQMLQTKTYSHNSSFTLYFRSSNQGSESNKLKLKMNCYIFDLHINCCFVADRRLEDGILFYTHDLVQVGPLNMIRSEVISAVKQEVRMISSYNVPVNWWTDFSSWQDFRGLLRSGAEFTIHKVVENFYRMFYYWKTLKLI